MNTIAVDAMGGDSAPVDIVKGAIKAKFTEVFTKAKLKLESQKGLAKQTN